MHAITICVYPIFWEFVVLFLSASITSESPTNLRVCVCSVGCGWWSVSLMLLHFWLACTESLHHHNKSVAVCYSIVTSTFQIVTIAAQNDSSSFENTFWIYVQNFIMNAICGPYSKSSTPKWSRGVHTLVGLQECPCWHVKGLKEEQTKFPWPRMRNLMSLKDDWFYYSQPESYSGPECLIPESVFVMSVSFMGWIAELKDCFTL